MITLNKHFNTSGFAIGNVFFVGAVFVDDEEEEEEEEEEDEDNEIEK